jgi:hypothetical protein
MHRMHELRLVRPLPRDERAREPGREAKVIALRSRREARLHDVIRAREPPRPAA